MADKVSLPKELVDLSDIHCPIIEPTKFGLPFHGLVVNGKLTLPNNKIIDYPQPKALSHKTTAYLNKGNYWCTNNGGFYAPSGSVITKYEKPYLGSTILVRGPKAKIPIRSAEEIAEDYKNGHQWKSYAYLSGTLRQLGSVELEPGTLNDYGDGVTGNNLTGFTNKEVSVIAKMYSQGYWLYNDGTITWLMKWLISPSTTDIKFVFNGDNYADPQRTITIWVVKPFGTFGIFEEKFSMTPIKIYEGNWDIRAKDRPSNNGYPIYLPFYSPDGSVLTISEIRNWFSVSCAESYSKYWLVQFAGLQWVPDLQMCDLNPNTGWWYGDRGETQAYAEINIIGKGSLNSKTPGQGIQVEFFPKISFIDWQPPGSGSYDWWGCVICSCVNTEGDRGFWWMEAWDPLPGVGYLKSSWGHSISFHYHTSIDDDKCTLCADTTNAPYYWINQGLDLEDNGTMIRCWTGPGLKDFVTVHLQSGPSCAGGISYDIINNRWSTIENSCYV